MEYFFQMVPDGLRNEAVLAEGHEPQAGFAKMLCRF